LPLKSSHTLGVIAGPCPGDPDDVAVIGTRGPRMSARWMSSAQLRDVAPLDYFDRRALNLFSRNILRSQPHPFLNACCRNCLKMPSTRFNSAAAI
jgi:hypothetical protein